MPDTAPPRAAAPAVVRADRPGSRGQDAPLRVVTAASLFDGHDAAIHVMRRILQASGCEVIHLGHNRSVRDIVEAALQEDVGAIAVSSYQGGHMEFFRYMVAMLRARGGGHIRVYGGGGGTIIPEEKATLEADGVARIFHPEDGRRLGLQGMIDCIIDESLAARPAVTLPQDSASFVAELRLPPASRDHDAAHAAEGPNAVATFDAATDRATVALARAVTLAEAAQDGRVHADAWRDVMDAVRMVAA